MIVGSPLPPMSRDIGLCYDSAAVTSHPSNVHDSLWDGYLYYCTVHKVDAKLHVKCSV